MTRHRVHYDGRGLTCLHDRFNAKRPEGGTSALMSQVEINVKGADLAKFTLSSANVLTFNVATDFETPVTAEHKCLQPNTTALKELKPRLSIWR